MRRSYLICLLALLPSCKEPPAGPAKTDLDAIRVSVRVQPTTVVAGTAATVIVTLKNTSAQPVAISSCPIYFWVQGQSGQIVGGSNLIACVAATLVYIPLRFDPLETKTLTFTWSAAETQNVPAGAYDVFGWANDSAHRSTAARVTVQPSN